ncbi:hypothetical protein BGZ47_010977 [Haplosporangium gracile]|nr:hypothetical protein BGZ47_010977 [Haplosporangium gracile]
MAFHDAVALANWINALPTTQGIGEGIQILQRRATRRCPSIGSPRQKYAYDHNASLTRFTFKNMPFWLWAIMMRKHIGCRLQASFLSPVPNTGTVPPADFPSYCETLKVIKAREAEQAAKAAQSEAKVGTNTVAL